MIGYSYTCFPLLGGTGNLVKSQLVLDGFLDPQFFYTDLNAFSYASTALSFCSKFWN